MVPETSLAVEVAELLREEHARVLSPLLRYMDALAERLEGELPVSAEEIRSGLDLWSRYQAELRGPRLRELFAPFLTVGANPACLERRRELIDNETLEKGRIPTLVRYLAFYSTGQYGARTMLTGTIRGFCAADRAWARYEEEFVSGCLVRPPPPEAQVRMRGFLEEGHRRVVEIGAILESLGPAVRLPSVAPPSLPA